MKTVKALEAVKALLEGQRVRYRNPSNGYISEWFDKSYQGAINLDQSFNWEILA